MLEFSDSIPINLICLAVLGALLLRRLVRMNGHHWMRVVILTVLLWLPTLYLFLLSWQRLFPPYDHYSCVALSEEPHVFCISEY